MKTQTIEAISELLEKLGPSFWGAITIRIQEGKLVNVVKEESLKIDAPDGESGTKFAR